MAGMTWRHPPCFFQFSCRTELDRALRRNLMERMAMDTNTLLIILVVIFLFGGVGYYGRGRWF